MFLYFLRLLCYNRLRRNLVPSRFLLILLLRKPIIPMNYTTKTHPVIAIDLDNTLWPAIENGQPIYPNPGTPFPWAIKTINKWIATGYEVIIWTARNNTEQATACKKRLLDSGINPNFKWNWYSNHSTSIFIQNKESSRKIDADIFFDDKAYGAPVYTNKTWEQIYHEFFN